jgi:hypothetical protein
MADGACVDSAHIDKDGRLDCGNRRCQEETSVGLQLESARVLVGVENQCQVQSPNLSGHKCAVCLPPIAIFSQDDARALQRCIIPFNFLSHRMDSASRNLLGPQNFGISVVLSSRGAHNMHSESNSHLRRRLPDWETRIAKEPSMSNIWPIKSAFLFLFALLLFASAGAMAAQDTRRVTEPVFPATCATISAPLGTSAGSIYSSDDNDTQSAAETSAIQSALNNCRTGEAVELEGTATTNAFLINPLTIPGGISLIVDGGVTIFGSRDPTMYQVSGSSATCGVTSVATGGCQALLTFLGDDSGLYGYGVVDGRGYAPMLTGTNAGQSWWYLTNTLSYTTGVTQNLPELVTADGDNFTLYKITLRNAAFYHVIWSNSAASPIGFTAWGVKIQSPWSVPNTDGIDIWGTNATVVDSTISEGDDDIAIDAWENPAANITINHVTAYGMNGITIGSGIGKGVSNVLIEELEYHRRCCQREWDDSQWGDAGHAGVDVWPYELSAGVAAAFHELSGAQHQDKT